MQAKGLNTVGRVILQKLSNISKLEKSGHILILPISISNVQMINLYNQHANLREEVNKKVAEKYRLNFDVDTYVHPNIGVTIINKTEELQKQSIRKNDVDTIINRDIKVETNSENVTFIVRLGEFYEDLADGKSSMFVDRLIKDLCQEKDIIYEFVHKPTFEKDKIILKVNTDFWEVAGNRIRNAFSGRIGEILANLIKSEKLDKEQIEEIFKTVVIKIMKLKEYNEKEVREFFINDKNLDILKDIRDNAEKHFILNSMISEYLPIHKELLFVLNKEKRTKFKSLSQCVEYQFFTMALVNSLIRENIYQNSAISGDDRGGYSEIINNLFFEGLRDIKHPGRVQIIKFVSTMFDTIDYDMLHYNLTDMQTIVQKFHGVNLAELNANKTVLIRLREDRDRLKNQLLVVNKYIHLFFALNDQMAEVSRFMRFFSDSNKSSNVSLRYILNGLKASNVSFNLVDIEELISFVDKFLISKSIDKMTTQINSIKSIATKHTKEWVEIKDAFDNKSFNIVMNKLMQEPIDFVIKKSIAISSDRLEAFKILLKDLRDYFKNDFKKDTKTNFTYSEKNQVGLTIKQTGKIDKELTGLVEKLSSYFEYFDSCDKKLVKNTSILNGYRAEDNSFVMGIITIFYAIFDAKHKNITEKIKRIRLSTGYKSKINIDNFYTLVKRIINYYKINHLYSYPLSSKPELLPHLGIPPTHIEYIAKTLEKIKPDAVKIYFGDVDLDEIPYDKFTKILDHFFNENEAEEIMIKEVYERIELYYESKKEELIEKDNLSKDSEFKIPERIINPNEGLKRN